MAIKEWSTHYPTSQDTPATDQPTLVNGVDDTRVSQIHTMRDKVDSVAKVVGDASNLPAGCLKEKVATAESDISGLDSRVTALEGAPVWFQAWSLPRSMVDCDDVTSTSPIPVWYNYQAYKPASFATPSYMKLCAVGSTSAPGGGGLQVSVGPGTFYFTFTGTGGVEYIESATTAFDFGANPVPFIFIYAWVGTGGYHFYFYSLELVLLM